MNTIGHERLTIIAQVINGHCQRAGSDHRDAPGPEHASPSSGSRKTYSIEKSSLPTEAIIAAGRMYMIDNTSGSATNRTRSPASANTTARATAIQTVCGGTQGVARMASA